MIQSFIVHLINIIVVNHVCLNMKMKFKNHESIKVKVTVNGFDKIGVKLKNFEKLRIPYSKNFQGLGGKSRNTCKFIYSQQPKILRSNLLFPRSAHVFNPQLSTQYSICHNSKHHINIFNYKYLPKVYSYNILKSIVIWCDALLTTYLPKPNPYVMYVNKI